MTVGYISVCNARGVRRPETVINWQQDNIDQSIYVWYCSIELASDGWELFIRRALRLRLYHSSSCIVSCTANYTLNNKKIELMLARRAKAYSSSCLQTVSLSPAVSSQFVLGMCAAAEDRKNQLKKPYFGSLESFKVIDVDTTEKLVTSACCDR